LKTELVPETEIKKAKDYISGTTLLDLETSESRAEFYGFQEVLKHSIEYPEEIIKKVNAVTAADVRKLAQEIFVNEGLNMAVVGKFKDGTGFTSYFKFN
jgi:predicted Zn-dependent peptidase